MASTVMFAAAHTPPTTAKALRRSTIARLSMHQVMSLPIMASPPRPPYAGCVLMISLISPHSGISCPMYGLESVCVVWSHGALAMPQ